MENLFNERQTDMPLELLLCNSDNPRQISKADFAQLIGDIQNDPTFLLAKRILVNHDTTTGNYTVYAGNQRLEACKVLGYKNVPCSVADNLPAEVMRKRALLDNHHAGEWDMEKLRETYDREEFEAMGNKFLTDLNIDFVEEIAKITSHHEYEKEADGAIIKYEIIFESPEQREQFDQLLASLRQILPDEETVSSRLARLAVSLLGAPNAFNKMLQDETFADTIERVATDGQE